MEERNEDTLQTPQETYKPRPKWQIVAAWIGLGVMLVCVTLYYLHIFTGGTL